MMMDDRCVDRWPCDSLLHGGHPNGPSDNNTDMKHKHILILKYLINLNILNYIQWPLEIFFCNLLSVMKSNNFWSLWDHPKLTFLHQTQPSGRYTIKSSNHLPKYKHNHGDRMRVLGISDMFTLFII